MVPGWGSLANETFVEVNRKKKEQLFLGRANSRKHSRSQQTYATEQAYYDSEEEQRACMAVLRKVTRRYQDLSHHCVVCSTHWWPKKCRQYWFPKNKGKFEEAAVGSAELWFISNSGVNCGRTKTYMQVLLFQLQVPRKPGSALNKLHMLSSV